jgi:tRNA(Ile)-lysidine synthase
VIAGVRDTIRRHAMLAGGEAVLVAVSGGPDSVALLWALEALAGELRLRLSVVHLDHGLRPDSADDAAFVTALARSRGLPVAVEGITIAPGGSLEARAREARYAALVRHATRLGADRVALGHTADDQAETVLMRLLEGAGPRGLAGIPPLRGIFIRPLIETRRSEILGALTAAGLAWREDPSNRDLKFLRNRIRHELLPFLAATYNPAIVTALNRAAALTRGLLGELAASAARELAAGAVGGQDEVVLARSRLAALPGEVAVEVLRLTAERLGGAAPLRSWAHRGLRRVLGDPPPRRPLRVGPLTVEVSGDYVRVARGPRPRLVPRPLAVPGLTPLPELGRGLAARVFERPPDYAAPREPDRVAFDADRLGQPLGVRGRRAGDRFVPFGAPGPRRLKSFLIDLGIPRWERPSLPLVLAGGEIVWVVGVRRAAVAPVTAATRRVLEIAAIPLAEGGTRGVTSGSGDPP